MKKWKWDTRRDARAATTVSRLRVSQAGRRLVLLLTATRLFIGLFVFRRAYEQYFVIFFPHLAIFGASWATEAAQDRCRC